MEFRCKSEGFFSISHVVHCHSSTSLMNLSQRQNIVRRMVMMMVMMKIMMMIVHIVMVPEVMVSRGFPFVRVLGNFYSLFGFIQQKLKKKMREKFMKS